MNDFLSFRVERNSKRQMKLIWTRAVALDQQLALTQRAGRSGVQIPGSALGRSGNARWIRHAAPAGPVKGSALIAPKADCGEADAEQQERNENRPACRADGVRRDTARGACRGQ